MAMISKDLIEKQKAEQKAKLQKEIADAVAKSDEEAMAKALTDFAEAAQQAILQEAQALSQEQLQDTSVLAARGIRQLTGAEQKWYHEAIAAFAAPDAKMAISNLSVAMPETIIDSVLQDMKQEYPILSLINFTNTMGVVKWIVNKQGTQAATWGAITSAITTELSGAFGEVDTQLYKLTAFMPISKGLLDLGPQWLDQYIRTVLSEANATALATAIVDGDGNGKPIGMTRSVADDVTVTGGVYPRKTAESVTELSPTVYGKLLSRLSSAPNGYTRPVNRVVLIVSPKDYFEKILPCTTVRTTDGKYSTDVFPYPTDLVQSIGVPEGHAIMGLPKRYFMGLGSPKTGKIEYDDSCQFLQDNRVYITKLYGNGMPLDDNAFMLLDISKLKPTFQQVQILENTTPPAK